MAQPLAQEPTLQLTVTLPPRVAEALLRHCERWNEQPSEVVADAVVIHLDAASRIAPPDADGAESTDDDVSRWAS